MSVDEMRSCQKLMVVPGRPIADRSVPALRRAAWRSASLRDSRYGRSAGKCQRPRPTTMRARDPPAATEQPARAVVADDYTQSLLIGLALFFGSVSVPLAAIAIVSPLAEPFSVVGVLLGAAALWRARQPRLALGLGKPAGVTALCLGLALFVGSWNAYREWMPQTIPATNPELRTVVGTGATVTAASKPVDAETWVDASMNAVQQNDVRVKIMSATVDYLKFKRAPPTLAPAWRLLLSLRLTSVNYTKVITYETWADPLMAVGKHEPRLTDNLNRVYRRVTFPAGTELAGVSSTVPVGG